MSNRAVVVWFVAGVPIALIDAWLSVQSMFGLINPTNAIGYLVGVICGLVLTGFAVYVPILKKTRNSIALYVVWAVAFGLDVITSVIGVIWYGVLKQPLNSPVEVSTLHWDFANWLPTLIFVGFVVAVAACCYKFGQALNLVTRRKSDARQVDMSYDLYGGAQEIYHPSAQQDRWG